VYQILLESTGFYGRYDKNILVCFFGLQCKHYHFDCGKETMYQLSVSVSM